MRARGASPPFQQSPLKGCSSGRVHGLGRTPACQARPYADKTLSMKHPDRSPTPGRAAPPMRQRHARRPAPAASQQLQSTCSFIALCCALVRFAPSHLQLHSSQAPAASQPPARARRQGCSAARRSRRRCGARRSRGASPRSARWTRPGWPRCGRAWPPASAVAAVRPHGPPGPGQAAARGVSACCRAFCCERCCDPCLITRA